MQHIFVFFATFLDDEKCCRNCVYPGTKRAWTDKIVYAGQKWAQFEKKYLHYDWTSDTKIWMAGRKWISPPIKWFYLFNFDQVKKC